MKLKELPVNAVIESLPEEDKKIYLPGILLSGIVDTEMRLAQADNPNERDEYKNLIDELYLCGSNNGINTLDLQLTVVQSLPIALEAEGI